MDPGHTLTVGSLCTGYGGAERALTLAGWDHRLAFVADIDPAAAKVLAHHHPDVPNLGDITRIAWNELGPVDLLTAGFPCTDVSSAGKRAGIGADTRSGVWSHVATAIRILQPPLVLLENVPGLPSTPANRSTDGPDRDVEPGPAGLGDGSTGPVLRAAGAVLGDLACLGFDAVWTVVSAASVGAPHLRKRVFILAWPAADPPRFGHRDCRSGTVGGLATAAVGGAAGTDGVTLLPTPAARLGDRWGAPNAETAARRMGKEGRRNLEDAIALLPTPRTSDTQGAGEHGTGGLDLRTAISLLPTPTARDGDGRGEGSSDYWQRRRDQLGRDNGIPLGAAVNLLPTPRATDGTKGGPNQAGSSGDLMLPAAVQPDRFGDYAPAIRRWETVLGRLAPDPTEPGKNGQPRLAAPFVEWMQGLPAGHVTAVPDVTRNDALRLLGNGIVPQQGAAAITHLAAVAAHLLATEATP